MRHVLSFAAAVAVTSPDGTLAPPAIYMIQIPSESEQPLSEEDTNAALAGNRWMVVGDRIVTAQLVQGENGAVDVAKWRPLCAEDYYGAQEEPVLLKTHLFDPHHPDYLEFRKCPSSKHEQAIWMFFAHARERRPGFMLLADGRLVAHCYIYDHMPSFGEWPTQLTALGHDTPGFHDGSDGHVVQYNGEMGINPLDTIGSLPPPYESEGDSTSSSSDVDMDSESEEEKQSTPRARGAGKRAKRQAVGTSLKGSPARKGRPPSRKLKSAVSAIARKTTLLRQKVSRVSSPKKATAAKLASTSPSRQKAKAARLPPSSPKKAVAAKKPSSASSSPKKLQFATPASSPKKPVSGAATLTVPSPGQTSPVRLTRSVVRQGIVSLPPVTPPPPEKRIAGPKSTQMDEAPQIKYALRSAASSGPLPAYTPPESQPVAGPSRIPMEHVPKVESGGYSLRPRGPRVSEC